MQYLDAISKRWNDLCLFPRQIISTTVIQVYAPTSKAEEAEIKCFSKGLQDLLVQFSSAIQSCLTIHEPMDHSTPGRPVHHQLPEFTQTHVHWVSDAVQPSHPLSSPSPPAFSLSANQGLFQWVNSSHHVAKVLEFQLQHRSFQWTPRTDLL